MPDLDTEELALVPLPLDSVLFVQLSAPAMRYFPSLSLKYSKFAFAKVCVSVRVSVVLSSSSSSSDVAQAAKTNAQKESSIMQAKSKVANLFLESLL